MYVTSGAYNISLVAPWIVVRWSLPTHCALVGTGAGRGFRKATDSNLGGDFPRQDCRGRRRTEGRWEEGSHTASRSDPALSSSSLTWTSATFALTLTSSAGLLPALKGSSRQLLKGPQDQQCKSRLPRLPPRGMCAAGAEGGERHSGG